MLWNSYIYFAVCSILLWVVGALFSLRDRRRAAVVLTCFGIMVFFAYILAMWISMERPPLRTMGETRLWYALFLPLCGLLVYLRRSSRWILPLTAVMATVFACINILKPEIHDRTLMPALQSPWFAPHVIVYMLAYALLGAATLMALISMFRGERHATLQEVAVRRERSSLLLSLRRDGRGAGSDAGEILSLVRMGWAFLTIGMLFGALWAKEAWGHYWTWDPKETWAAVTWLSYLVYIHLGGSGSRRLSLAWLLFCFVLLQMCWWGINFLPSAQATSVHTYAS